MAMPIDTIVKTLLGLSPVLMLLAVLVYLHRRPRVDIRPPRRIEESRSSSATLATVYVATDIAAGGQVTAKSVLSRSHIFST
jgi:hypothetical protein